MGSAGSVAVADFAQNWRSSSKLEALVEELEKLRAQDCTIKSLVLCVTLSL